LSGKIQEEVERAACSALYEKMKTYGMREEKEH
jgi:hypothetical protein